MKLASDADAAQVTDAARALLDPWAGPYGGVPPFDRVEAGLLAPALEAAMRMQLAEIERIATDAAAPAFENTIAELERSGRAFSRAFAVHNVFSSTMKSEAFQAVEREMAPRLAAHRDRIVQNEKLFARIAAVHERLDAQPLTAEQKRLAWLKYTDFVRGGARLQGAPRERLTRINQRLASLFTQFNQNVLADEARYMLLVERVEDLDGLPESVVAGAAAAAEERGHPGRWAILNTRSSVEPFLAYSNRRDLRERVWRKFCERGDHGDAHDNKDAIAEILALRHERARLLGYPTHAHWRLERSMAKTPERAMALMEAVWKPAVARVAVEVAEMQDLADAQGAGIAIEPWDYRYYAEKVRLARYRLDANELKPYLELERLREAMFWVAGELFALRFTPVADVPVYHPDVRVWRVSRDGEHVGLFYFDPYARAGKSSGAWMNAYRPQERFDGEVSTIVSNNCNFVKPPAGEPVLISWEDARTLFHEFGHALHGLNSDVEYPSLSGTAVDRDYVEFPSQLLEHWLRTPEVLKRFARHCRTGEPMPDALLAKLDRAATFNQGFDTVEYLASAIVDMRMHLEPDKARDVAAFERETLALIGMPRQVAMRHRLPHFNHLFASDGYSAGYYSYLWADTLVADAFEAFLEAGGPYDREVARRLRECVLSRGNTVDPAAAYREFRGRDAGIEALMRKRGFSAAAA
ncbi:MAG TPA: M3 family metallopeptidase [Usitatibacter sp.]|nr:M3 family metallopeptidase [Usitatibacter sp.]